MPIFPDEIWSIIIRFVVADPKKDVDPDDRAALSLESLTGHLIDEPEDIAQQDLTALRCSFRQLGHLAARERFQTIAVRHHSDDLRRLDAIARSHVSKHVKKLVYKVPLRYMKGPAYSADPPRIPGLYLPPEAWAVVRTRLYDQTSILSAALDQKALATALEQFTSLQHVVVLQLLDRHDRTLQRLAETSESFRDRLDLQWTPACTHVSHMLLPLTAKPQCHTKRFSIPLSLDSASQLSRRAFDDMSQSCHRITHLTIHFTDAGDLGDRTLELHRRCNALLKCLPSIVNLFLGFYYPLDLPLNTIFADVNWSNLRVFGIQGWKLEWYDIEAFLHQHGHWLKGLRLRDVFLKEGSKWKDLLLVLRKMLPRLCWISLLRIGYASHFDAEEAARGHEVLDDFMLDCDDEDEGDQPYDELISHAGDGGQDEAAVPHGGHLANGANGNTSPGMDAHRNDLPDIPSPTTPQTSIDIFEHVMDSVDVLEDDDDFIPNEKRKMWERWVLRKNPQNIVRSYLGCDRPSKEPHPDALGSSC